MSNKNDTLYGGREIAVKVFTQTPGTTRDLKLFVRQFRIKEYRQLFPISDDEIKLCARATDQPEEVIGDLTQDSYERVYKAMLEVNGEGFFLFRQRELERASDRISAMPAEMVERLVAKSSSTPPLPGSALRRV